MFKKGDRIKCISLPLPGNNPLKDQPFCLGKHYIVEAIHPGDDRYIMLLGELSWFDSKKFILHKELISELDFLDAFQQNFKEGV